MGKRTSVEVGLIEPEAGINDRGDGALERVLAFLAAADYRFVAPNLATHATVRARHRRARHGNLRDVFGWNRRFGPDDIPPVLLDHLSHAEIMTGSGDELKLTMRVASIGDRLHLHSSSNRAADAVFLGPDSYRFVRLIEAELADDEPVSQAIDIGVGAGAGALAVAAMRPKAQVWGSDVNPAALRLFSLNARASGAKIKAVHGSGLSAVTGMFDLIVANPPFIAGRGGRVYRDGGDLHGARLALDWVEEALPRLTLGGRLILYTGSPVVEGRDLVREGVNARLTPGLTMTHQEIDPDIFGSMLQGPAYRSVERIAAVGVVVRRIL